LPKRQGWPAELRTWVREDAVALCWGGYALAYVAVDVDGGRAFVDKALALNPNLAAAWNFSGWIRIFLGEHQSAIDRFERALRLSPRDPTVFHMRIGVAYANFLAGNYETASSAAQDALRNQAWLGGLRVLAASKALFYRIRFKKVGATVGERQPLISAASFGGMGGADELNAFNASPTTTFPVLSPQDGQQKKGRHWTMATPLLTPNTNAYLTRRPREGSLAIAAGIFSRLRHLLRGRLVQALAGSATPLNSPG
jgi:hypothetical protein